MDLCSMLFLRPISWLYDPVIVFVFVMFGYTCILCQWIHNLSAQFLLGAHQNRPHVVACTTCFSFLFSVFFFPQHQAQLPCMILLLIFSFLFKFYIGVPKLLSYPSYLWVRLSVLENVMFIWLWYVGWAQKSLQADNRSGV